MQAMSVEFVQRAIDNILENEKCADMHEYSCNRKALNQLIYGCKSVSKLYLFVHLIPLMLKFNRVRKSPRQEITKFVTGYVKSLLFAGMSLLVIRRTICFITQHYAFTNLSTVLAGFVCSLALLFESQGRQIEISLFTLQKGMENVYGIIGRRHSHFKIPYGECWLNAIAFSLITYHYLQNKQLFRKAYQKVISMFLTDI